MLSGICACSAVLGPAGPVDNSPGVVYSHAIAPYFDCSAAGALVVAQKSRSFLISWSREPTTLVVKVASNSGYGWHCVQRLYEVTAKLWPVTAGFEPLAG